jgi:hypothetical protein
VVHVSSILPKVAHVTANLALDYEIKCLTRI